MSEKGTVEKKASSPEERAEVIRAAILSAVGAAGIGAIVRNMKASKDRKKDLNPENARNAIIIPVKKTNFMADLPTPEELAKSRGEQPGQSAGETVAGAAGAAEEMTPEQIAAKKNEILRGGRKFDFFGKHASAKQAGVSAVKVAQTEKAAISIDGLWDSVVHPVKTIGSNIGAMVDKPVLLTAGALGSIYLAAKISDAINEQRLARAKNRLEHAREEYVGLLEGENEKDAESKIDLRTTPGAMLGGAFLIPAALTALVTSKIIENRKIEKKQKKEQSDSYPDEPLILYKTSEAQEIPISPETALAVFLVKRAMFISSERSARGGLGKEAAGKEMLRQGIASGLESFRNGVEGAKNMLGKPMSEGEAVDFATNMMVNPNNNEHLLSMVRGFVNNDKDAQHKAFLEMFNRLPAGDKGRLIATLGQSDDMPAKLVSGIKTSQLLNDTLVKRFQDSKYADTFGKYREELVNNELGKTFKKDGILFNIISWIMNNMGLGKYMVGNKINEMFAANREKQRQAAQLKPLPKPGPAVADVKPPAVSATPPSAPKAPIATPVVKTPTLPEPDNLAAMKPVATKPGAKAAPKPAATKPVQVSAKQNAGHQIEDSFRAWAPWIPRF